MSELWTLNKFNLPHVSSCADGLIVQDLRSWRKKKKKTSHNLSHHSYTHKKNNYSVSQRSHTSVKNILLTHRFMFDLSTDFLLLRFPTQAFTLHLLFTIRSWQVFTFTLYPFYFAAAVMLCMGGFEVCKWEMSDSPTYSGVPRISRTSVTLSTRRDKPKSTIRMSPRGWALVNRMFWGWRRQECERKETLNYTSDRKKKRKRKKAIRKMTGTNLSFNCY